MHGRAHHHFAGFQVHMPRLAPAVEEDMQPLVYFAGDLLKDRSSRFFSSGVHVLLSDSSGRCLQIFSLTEISSVLSSWKRWCSSISDCAFRQAAGEGNESAAGFSSVFLGSRILWLLP